MRKGHVSQNRNFARTNDPPRLASLSSHAVAQDGAAEVVRALATCSGFWKARWDLHRHARRAHICFEICPRMRKAVLSQITRVNLDRSPPSASTRSPRRRACEWVASTYYDNINDSSRYGSRSPFRLIAVGPGARRADESTAPPAGRRRRLLQWPCRTKLRGALQICLRLAPSRLFAIRAGQWPAQAARAVERLLVPPRVPISILLGSHRLVTSDVSGCHSP